MNDIFDVVALGSATDIVDRPAMLDHLDLRFAVLAHNFEKLAWLDASVGMGLPERDNPLGNVPSFFKHLFDEYLGIGLGEYTDVFLDFLFREYAVEHIVFLLIRTGFGIGRIKIHDIAFDFLQEVEHIHAVNFVLLMVFKYPSVDDVLKVQKRNERVL